MARKTYGVSLNDADPEDAQLMEWLEQEQSVSIALREALWMRYTGAPQQDGTTQAIVEAIDRQGDKLVRALGNLHIMAGGYQGDPIDPTSRMTKNLLGADDIFKNEELEQ